MRCSNSFLGFLSLGLIIFIETGAAHPSKFAPLRKRGVEDQISPAYTRFQAPLAIPPQISPLVTYTNATTGEIIDFYEITIRDFTKQVYPNKPATALQGYNGMAPGPIFRISTGRKAVVRFINRVANPASVHLHGSPTRPPWDGWAEDTILTGQYKDYFYPNKDALTMWYHDHAVGITAVNAFRGQAGIYICFDPDEEAALNLPQGAYDIPIVLADKIYTQQAALVTPDGETDSYFGDVIHANGVPWPYLNVEPRKYRFRLLDASVSRTYKLEIRRSNGNRIPMVVVAADSGYIPRPVSTNTLILAIAERYEIVVDFTNFAGQTLTMRNARDFARNTDFTNTDYVMEFRVGRTVTSTAGNGAVPSILRPATFPSKTTVDHEFSFERTEGEWRINDIGFVDVTNRVLAAPANGEVEVWDLENRSGGWVHPIHIHLVAFKVISRSGGDDRGVEPYEQGFKDVVFLDKNERARVVARFHPWAGQYMFHCHNLVHEDHDMMAAFDVNNTLADPDNNGDRFSNPMAAEFRPTRYTGTDLRTVRTETLPRFSGLDAYSFTARGN